ncbi:hypothetical protein KY092_10805 [Natronomonas gomsonensis]|jgi:hypothetical protein|uniref:hypothetical protein n=1 Tax=Natronomonas gomsonensis TaxID=1046043 RepID=UPI0020CA3934|nr:hypothetical protein [Natronomonas gomsonensis]MCY4731043.1 hypothetical protein [Natronomonas gomsonensis]
MQETRQFRGISKRLAADYLENLGGARTDESGDRIEGDGWHADLSEEQVDVVGSITLTEVTVDFEGDDETLEPLIEDFARKAMRAGG